jgi:hypothetical protein
MKALLGRLLDLLLGIPHVDQKVADHLDYVNRPVPK